MDLFRTKSVEHIGADARGEGADGGVGRLRRHLSARHLVGFGIGVVIGTGIFTLTGVQARNTAGPSVVISFAVAGVVALLAALCYAEPASSVPTAGSAYSYAYATTGEQSTVNLGAAFIVVVVYVGYGYRHSRVGAAGPGDRGGD